MRFHVLKFSLVLAFAFASAGVAAKTPSLAEEETSEIRNTITGRFMLVNHFGEAVSNADFRGKFLLVSFGYTFCPDVCPTTLATLSRTLKLLGDSAARVQPLFVSVDPERDTPKVLRDYVVYFHPDIIGLTGTPELVSHAAGNFNVTYAKVVNPGSDPKLYAMDHSAGIYLMGPDGAFITKFGHTLPPEVMAERIKSMLQRE